MKRFLVNNDIELREVTTDDVMPMFTTINSEREHLSKWLPFVDYTKEVDDTQHFVKSVEDKTTISGELVMAIYYINTFVGVIGFKNTDMANRRTEIGYWLSKVYQGKGIITMCCKRMIDYAFNELNINRVQIKVATHNYKSIKITERLGFTYEGTERDGELLTSGFTDINVYSLLKIDPRT